MADCVIIYDGLIFNSQDEVKEYLKKKHLASLLKKKDKDRITKSLASKQNEFRAIEDRIRDMSLEEYVKEKTKENQQKIADINDFQKHLALGTQISRFARTLSIYREIENNIYDQYSYRQNLIFSTGYYPDYIYNNLKSKEAIEKRKFDWQEHGGQHYSKEVSRSYFHNKQQHTLDNTVNKIVGNIVSKLEDSKVAKGVKDNLVIHVTSESGIDEAIAKAFSKRGYKVVVHMIKGNRFVSNTGKFVYDTESMQISKNRYRGYNVTFEKSDAKTQTGVLYKQQNGTDAYVVLNAQDEKFLKNVRLSKKKVTLGKSDLDTPNHIEKLISDFIKNSYLENTDIQSGNKKEYNVFFTGTNIFTLNHTGKSQYELWLEKEQAARNNFDIAEALKSRPNLREYIKLFEQFYQLKFKLSAFYGKHFERVVYKYMKVQHRPTISKQEFNALEKEFQKVVLDYYWRTADHGMIDVDLLHNPVSNTVIEELNQSKLSDPVIAHLDLRRSDHSAYFVEAAPEWAMALKESFPDNIFIQDLEIDSKNGFLVVKNSLDRSPEETLQYRTAFDTLPTNIKDVFWAYNMLRNGFVYFRQSLNPYIGAYRMGEVSKFIDKSFTAKENNIFNAIAKDEKEGNIRDKFIVNAIVDNPTLSRYYGDTAKTKEPMVKKLRLPGSSISLPAITEDVDGHPEEFFVYSMNYGKIQRLPVERDAVLKEEFKEHAGKPTDKPFTLPVVKLNNLQNISEWIEMGSTEINYLYGHKYKFIKIKQNDEYHKYIFVNYDLAEVMAGSTSTKIKVKKVDNPAAILQEIKDQKYVPVTYATLKDEAKARNVYFSKVIFKRRANNKAVQSILSLFGGNVPIVIENSSTAIVKGLKGYVLNGKIHINTDLASLDSPVHEMAHIYLWANPNSEALVKARQEMENDTELVKKIRAKYPELDNEGLVYEVAATQIGFSSEELVEEYYHNSTQQEKKGIIETGKRLLKQFLNWISRVFGVRVEQGDVYRDVAKKIIEEAKTGKLKFSQQDIINLQENYEMETAASKDLEGLDDLPGVLLSNDKMPIDYVIRRREIQRFKNSIAYWGWKAEVGNKVIDFSNVANDNEAFFKKYMKEYLPLKEKEETNIKSGLRDWLNLEKGKGNIKKAGDYFKNASTTTLDSAKKFMGYTTGTNVKYLSEVLKEELSRAGISHFFIGKDPLVLIHKIEKDTMGNISSIEISMVDVETHKSVWGVGMNNKLITSNFISDKEASALGVSLQAKTKEVSRLMLMFQVMKLKQALGDKINIRTVGTLYAPDKVLQKATFSSLNVMEMLRHVKALGRVKPFMDAIHPEIRDLLDDETLLKRNKYFVDHLTAALNTLRSKAFNNTDYKGVGKELLEQDIDMIESYIRGEGDRNTLIAALRVYKRIMEEDIKSRLAEKGDASKTSIERALMEDEEYRTVSMAIFSLYQSLDITEENIKKVGTRAKWVFTMNNQRNVIMQTFHSEVEKQLSVISGMFKETMKEVNKATEELIKSKGGKIQNILFDLSEGYFKNIFKTEEINGKRVYTGEIHWDEKDEQTKKALAKNELTKEELAYGKFVAEKTEQWVKGLIRATVMQSVDIITKDGIDEAEVEKRTEDIYAKVWRKGMIPIISKDTGKFIAQGRFVEAFQRFMKSSQNTARFYEDMVDINTEESIGMENNASLFLGQILGSDPNNLSQGLRGQLLGLSEEEIGKIELVDEKRNTAFNMNLHQVMMYLAMDAISKPIMDQKVIPAAEEAKIMSKAIALTYLADPQAEKALNGMIDQYVQRVVYGKHQRQFDNEILEKATGVGKMLIRITTFSGVALSVPVAITSLTANQVEAITFAIANKFGNPGDFFTPGDYTSAIKEYTKNYKKVKAVTEFYNVVESDRFSLLVNPRYDVTAQKRFNKNSWHFMNRWTDVSIRQIVAVAQMIHDGTWDAHSIDKDGNVVYDAKKDKRFKAGDEKSKVLYDGLVRDLMDDERVKQEKDKPPVRAYDAKEERKLEYLGSEFVVGVYDSEGKPLGDDYFFYKALLQFRHFMTAKWEIRMGTKFKSDKGGHWVVEKDEKRMYQRMWQAFEREGSWVTASKMFVKSVPFVSQILAKYQFLNDVHTVWDVKNMTELEKHNLARAVFDLAVFVVAYMAYMGLKGMGSDDDKKSYMRLQRIIRAVKNGAYTTMLTSPDNVLDLLTSIPIITTVKNMYQMVFKGDLKKGKYMLPMGTLNTVWDVTGWNEKGTQSQGY